MKDKWFSTLKTIGIVLCVALGLALILHIPAVDNLLTEWIGSPLAATKEDVRIVIPGWAELLPAEEAPYVYEQDGKLMLLYGGLQGGPQDITPEGVNIAFYATKHDITAELRTRKQCTLREDGKQMLFLLHDRDVPTLFLTDLTQMTTVKVATNVDSFLFVGETVVYACGYARANQLYMYDGTTTTVLAENVQSMALSQGTTLASLDKDGKLFLHQVPAGASEQIAEGVLEIYRESAQASNVTVPTVFCRKEDGDYTITAEGETRLVSDVRFVVGSKGDRVYTFCESKGILFLENGDQPVSLFTNLGSVYRILDWNERLEELLVSTGKGIYLLRLGVEDVAQATAVQVLSYTGDFKIYKNNPTMIEGFLRVDREGADRFYVQAVSGKSFILNRRNPESWMNFGSSYLYGLWYVDLQGSKLIACDVPASRSLQPLIIRAEMVVYLSAYDDAQIRSITTLTQGCMVAKDLLGTYRASKGQTEIIAEMVGGEVYFTVTPWGEAAVHSRLSADGTHTESIEKRIVSSFGFAYELD
ncbi:MAG: hypothetical protein IKU26_02105 [Clostridia bacterium]|nr:hypothetical protein [Clostridia bacterium]